MKLKSYLSKRMNRGNAADVRKNWRRIRSFHTVSFDLFDTLLKRDVASPDKVFDLMEAECGEEFPDFARKRKNAERAARACASREEITLSDIYAQYEGISAEERENLKLLELDTERKVLTISKEMVKLFASCVKAGKRVYLITDMYLSREFLEQILASLEITGYEKLYVSSEICLTKRSGNLFSYIRDQEKLAVSDWIHIGDSFSADYLAPKKLGIAALHIPLQLEHKSLAYSQVRSAVCNKDLYAFINNRISIKSSCYEQFGYAVFGPFLWGFVHWLEREAQKQKLDKLFFLSRDGFIMKKAFEICNSHSEIDCRYLEVSRRSLRVPLLWENLDYQTLLDMVTPSRRVSLLSFFDGLGLDIGAYEDRIRELGLNRDSAFDRSTIAKEELLQKLFEELKADAAANAREEYRLLKAYLEQEQLGGRFGLVDIGWSGSMQRYILTMLRHMKIEAEISGFYVGVADYYLRNEQYVGALDLSGYLFDFKQKKEEKDYRNPFVGLFEMLFLENSGSVIGYEEKNGRIAAVRGAYEYFSNGRKSEEQMWIEAVQEGALKFCSDIEASGLFLSNQFSAWDLFQPIYQAGTRPNRRMLRMFSSFRFEDEGEVRKLADPRPLFFYLLSPAGLKNDFLASRWKTGFMKKLFQINLPYDRMYYALRRRK